MITISGMKHSQGARNRRHTSDERGMAAIVITMVTMVVISLIVIGFATVSRREQRQSLDQLQSAQAFYAAESGIEDVKGIIKANIAAGQPIIAKDDCVTNNPSGTYPTGSQTVVDTEYGVSYTCLKVDPEPETLLFDGVGGNSIVIPLTSDSAITAIEIKWRPTTGSTDLPSECPAAALNSFSPQSGASGWDCDYGVLRADVVPVDGALTRAGLAADQLTGFFVPLRSAAAGTLSYNGNTGRANVSAANCNVGSYTSCTARITNITGSKQQISLRLSSMYQPSNISIQTFSGASLKGISGVQAVVDSTGKATDVLRRIQVRLPLVQTGGLLPGNALSSNGAICKRFNTAPGYLEIPAGIVNPDDGPINGNAMCGTMTSGAL